MSSCRRWRSVAAGAAALLVAAAARAEPAADLAPPSLADGPLAGDDDTRALFVRATEAADNGDLETARALYAEVWLRRQTYDVAMNLAEIEAHLDRPADAATHAAHALALFPPSEDPDTRRHLEALLERSRAGLAELTVTAPAGARVTVDGVFVGVAPLVAPVFVRPGPRTLEAARGGRTARLSVEAARGERRAVTLTLAAGDEAPGAGAAAPAGSPAPPPREAGGRRPGALAPLLASAGVTVLGASLGVGFAILAYDAREDAERLDSDNDSRCTANPSTTSCAALAEARDRVDRDRTARDVAFVGAGVGLAATGLFAVLLTHAGGGRARLEPVLSLDVDAAWVGVRGSLPAGPPGRRGRSAARACPGPVAP